MSTLVTVVTAAADVVQAVGLDIPDPAAVKPPGFDGIDSIMGWAKWAALAVCIVALIGVGALMALPSRRSEGGEHAGNVGKVLMGVVVISAAAALVGFLS